MTDREMLELAAEAMGLLSQKRVEVVDADDKFIGIKVRHNERERYHLWNPLTDPADTAEMCAALEIDTIWLGPMAVCLNDPAGRFTEPHDNTTQGKLAAWMRAATRAAAEVALTRRKG